MSHYDISPHEADNRNHTQSPERDVAVDPQLPRVTGPTNSRRSAISRQWQHRTCTSTAAEPYATIAQPRPPYRLANAQSLTTDLYAIPPLDRSSDLLRGSGITVRAPGTTAEPYAPQPGHLAHPPLPSAGSTLRAGKSHALTPRQHIIARHNNPRPPSLTTTRHRYFHRGSDIKPPTQPARLPPGVRSVHRQSHAPQATTTSSFAPLARITRGHTHR